MKIWHLKFEVDRYDNLAPVKEFSVEKIWAFDGRKLEKSWKPLPVKRMEPQKKLKLSDALDQFRQTVEKHKLTGFKFRLAWDSDRTG